MGDKKDQSKVTTPDVVQRGDDVVYESREGIDRRGNERGLNPGRRLVDHHRVRSQFNERVEMLHAEGASAETIARILNDEDFPTAGGSVWTVSAIEQLLKALNERRNRDAWLPASLTESEHDEDG